MISVGEAKQLLLNGLRPVGTETISIDQAAGRVLADSVFARLTRPDADISAMDGYAVRSEDLPGSATELREVDQVPAGSVSQKSLGKGECARIFTGAHLPAGADAILIQEEADRHETDDGVRIVTTDAVQAGAYVRQRGMDFSAGEQLLQPDHRLTARDVGLLAAANVPWISVRRKPRIAILATGDEIVLPGETIGLGQIVGSAGHALSALIDTCGGQPVLLGVAKDDPDALSSAAANAESCDFLVTIGGASVGDYDLIHDVLGARGTDIKFHKIAMRPGKPLMFGASGSVRLLGLPGNPVSSYLCALLFLRPAINALLNCPQDDELINMPTVDKLQANGPREHYMRSRVEYHDGTACIKSFDDQDSSLVATLARADGLIVRPVNAAPVQAGDLVPVLLFRDSPASL